MHGCRGSSGKTPQFALQLATELAPLRTLAAIAGALAMT
jgi:hypothetical protein